MRRNALNYANVSAFYITQNALTFANGGVLQNRRKALLLTFCILHYTECCNLCQHQGISKHITPNAPTYANTLGIPPYVECLDISFNNLQ